MTEVENAIRIQARAALTAGIISIIIFGFVFGPGALIRAGIVRDKVRRHNVGHEYLSRANTATILGLIGLVIWTVGFAIAVSR